MSAKNGPPATEGQVIEALEGLDDQALARLRKEAKHMIVGTRFDHPHDLINETVERLLARDRLWPIHVPFERFFSNAMRSVAYGIRHLKRQKSEVLAADHVDVAAEDEDPIDLVAEESVPSVEASLISEEDRQAAARDIAAIEENFKNDSEVSMILMGIEDEISPAELREMAGMSQTEYETARKRLRRGLERLSLRGNKS